MEFVAIIRQRIKCTGSFNDEGNRMSLSFLVWWIFIQNCQECLLPTMSCSLNMLYSSLSGKESKDLLEKNMLHKQQRSSLIQKQNTPFKTIFFFCFSPSPQPSKFGKMISNIKWAWIQSKTFPLIHIRKLEQDGYIPDSWGL